MLSQGYYIHGSNIVIYNKKYIFSFHPHSVTELNMLGIAYNSIKVSLVMLMNGLECT